jgi:hypothetical protein
MFCNTGEFVTNAPFFLQNGIKESAERKSERKSLQNQKKTLSR